ncbi:MAG: hypothetical protein RIR90_137, partial [Bacteroidota bacterium]
MKMKRLLMLLVILTGLLPAAYSQAFKVSGKVVSAQNNQPLVGASVVVKGSNGGTTTNEMGLFSLTVPAAPSTIVVSFAGMESVERTVNGATTLNIVLQEVSSQLNDVVVVGYGTQKITKVSGAISTVKSGDIEKLVPARAEEAIQGRAAGVNVIQGGSPGSRPTVLIRGIPSFTGTDPVIIIDGVPQTLTDFNSINAGDI